MNICTCATQNDISRNHLISRQHKKLIKGKLLTQNLFIHRAPFLQQHIYIIEPKCHPCHLGLHVLTQLSINNVKKVPKRLKSTLVHQLQVGWETWPVGKEWFPLGKQEPAWGFCLPATRSLVLLTGEAVLSGRFLDFWFLDCCLSSSPSLFSQDWGTDSSWNSLTPLLVLTSVGR